MRPELVAAGLHGCCLVGPRRGLVYVYASARHAIEGYITLGAFVAMGLEDAVGEGPVFTETTIDIEDVDEFMRGTEVEQTTYVTVASSRPYKYQVHARQRLLVGHHLRHWDNRHPSTLPRIEGFVEEGLFQRSCTSSVRPTQLIKSFSATIYQSLGLDLDCVVDSPVDVVEAEGSPRERPILTGCQAVAATAGVLCHSVEKRTRVDPSVGAPRPPHR